MIPSEKPGIGIENIWLMDCVAGIVDPNAKPTYRIGLLSLSRTISPDGLTLNAVACFDMMNGIEKPVCTLRCTFAAIYSRNSGSAMTWEEFTDVMAVTHMIPYVREFVSSVTLRMPLNALVLPPTNVHLLVDEWKALPGAKQNLPK